MKKNSYITPKIVIVSLKVEHLLTNESMGISNTKVTDSSQVYSRSFNDMWEDEE